MASVIPALADRSAFGFVRITILVAGKPGFDLAPGREGLSKNPNLSISSSLFRAGIGGRSASGGKPGFNKICLGGFVMSEERMQILEMLAKGKVSVAEAERLLDAVGDGSASGSQPKGSETGKKYPKYLVVTVDDSKDPSGKPRKVNVRVPFQMLRAGVKLASLIPVVAKDKINQALSEHGMKFDVDSLKPENLQEIIDAMEDMTVDINGGEETVKVYCE
jgi:hypothetical protein